MENKFVIQVQPRVQGDTSRIVQLYKLFHTPFGLRPQGAGIQPGTNPRTPLIGPGYLVMYN